jgi:hypothetical protein
LLRCRLQPQLNQLPHGSAPTLHPPGEPEILHSLLNVFREVNEEPRDDRGHSRNIMHIAPIDKGDITIYIVATAHYPEKDSTVSLTIPVTLTKKKSRAASDTEEGYLDLSAVNEGLITIERDGSLKDTPNLTALITALDARAAKLRAKLRTEGLDIMLDPTLTTFRDASMAYHATAITLEGLAEMLSIADRIHSNLVDSIEDQMESSSDYLVSTAREIEKLLAA